VQRMREEPRVAVVQSDAGFVARRLDAENLHVAAVTARKPGR
jgi:hypothetical protein